MYTAIYARQSVNKKDSVSIETQIEICRREIRSSNEVKIYQDKGFSGKNIFRPAFKQLMCDVESGQIKNIIVYKLDRISRSVVDFANIVDILNKNNVDFMSANEKFDTSSPAGKAMIYIVMVFAQLERETIAERIRDNYYQRGSDGVWLGGPAPFGYNNLKITVNGKRVAAITENDDIETVKWIYEQYSLPEASLGKIARQLVFDRNEMWNNIKLSRILHNPAYVKADVDIYNYLAEKGCIMKSDISQFNGENGLNVYGKRNKALNKYNNIKGHNVTVGLHNGVIPSRLWLECQYKLERNVQIKNSGKGKHTWLTGLIKCGYCGRALVVRTYKNTKYLNCSGRAMHLCDDEIGTIYLTAAENAVSANIKKYIKIFSECKINDTESRNKTEINKLKLDLFKIDDEINSIVNNISSANEVMMKYANAKIVELDNQKNILTNMINELNSECNNKPVLPDVENWEAKDSVFKKQIASLIIDKIFIFNDRIEIKWKY